MIDQDEVINRFIRYVKIDSQSNPQNDKTPSSSIQWNMANLLKKELEKFGLQDVSIDDNAYVMGKIHGNVDYDLPAIGFISHFDTSPDFNASNIQPQTKRKIYSFHPMNFLNLKLIGVKHLSLQMATRYLALTIKLALRKL